MFAACWLHDPTSGHPAAAGLVAWQPAFLQRMPISSTTLLSSLSACASYELRRRLLSLPCSDLPVGFPAWLQQIPDQDQTMLHQHPCVDSVSPVCSSGEILDYGTMNNPTRETHKTHHHRPLHRSLRTGRATDDGEPVHTQKRIGASLGIAQP